MSEYLNAVAAVIFAVVVWATSAAAIGTECERLGAFYVGSTVYKCEVKK